MTARPAPPIALTIAGSDSGGGAGIQADLKTFHQFEVFGTSAITAITVQNTLGVTGVHPVPVETVAAQIDAIATDLTPAATKTGMLATRELVERIVDRLGAHALPNVVVDPVMVASSGHRLLDADAERAVAELLLPRASLVTPNLHEASILVGRELETEDDLLEAAQALVEMGAGAALVKGGHLRAKGSDAPEAVDLLWDGRKAYRWRRARIETRNTHGTGCTLSSAIAAELARGSSRVDAVARGIDFVARAIRSAPDLGAGHGPVDHFVPAHAPHD